MILYIPTSSLNFNNILSTESISPKIFYEKRGFGYSRWFSVPENKFQSIILLYEEPRRFVRPKSDLEDYPLLIEISTDEEYPVLQEGIRYSDRTVYINPWRVRFLFFSEKDKQIVLSLSKNSLETKMVRLYWRRMEVITEVSGKYPTLNESFETPLCAQNIVFDRRIDKIKGLLYGYYIGANLSTDIDTVDRMNLLYEIQNIFVAISNSPDKRSSVFQIEKLEYLFHALVKREPLFQELLQKIGNEKMVYDIIEIFKKYGFNGLVDWRKLLSARGGKKESKLKAVDWTQSELSRQKVISDKKKVLLFPKQEEIVTAEGYLMRISEAVVQDPVLQSLYKAWINEVLSSDEYTGQLGPQKEKLSDALTIKAKEVLGNDWEDSLVRSYMNKLRRHIRGEAFDCMWDNGVLSSIAACLIKGDDWEQMYLFMQKQGMTDYRLAFSFYGVLNGFANLPRDYTDLLLNLDSPYVATVYQEFLKQLHSVTIPIMKKSNEKPERDDVRIKSKLAVGVLAFFDSPSFNYKAKSETKDKLRNGLLLALSEVGNEDYKLLLAVLKNKYKSFGWGGGNKPWKLVSQFFSPTLPFVG